MSIMSGNVHINATPKIIKIKLPCWELFLFQLYFYIYIFVTWESKLIY